MSDITHNKAWTAVALKMPAASVALLAVLNGELYGFITTNQRTRGRVRRGIPLSFEGKIVRAVGARVADRVSRELAVNLAVLGL
ncbi:MULTISPECIES: hypothetical protein [Paenibacillus]|uniref:Uncharacterized protein n=2 Tax=Paenibacillaceae TaxID=186822 RepID=A0ABW3PNJ4_9BACL